MRTFVFALTIIGVYVVTTQAEPKVMAPYTQRTNIAHRGASFDAPEHTVAAYELALKYGADFVEPDLQLTKDGVLICLHDDTLDRTTDVAKQFPDRFRDVKGKKTWPVGDFTWAEIQTLDAGLWKGEKYRGSKVPSFQQMIDLVKGKAGIIPETKQSSRSTPSAVSMETALMKVLADNKLDQPGADPKTPVIIQSFSSACLKSLRNEHRCKLPLVFLFSKGEKTAPDLAEIRKFADGIGPEKAVIAADPALVTEAHRLGMSVTVWTFRTGRTGSFKTVREEMKHFLDNWMVDAVFTDNPDQFPRD